MCLFKSKKITLSKDEKIKTAIIGFGGMAGYHLGKMRASGLFNPIGAYDVDPKALEKARKKGLKAFNSFEELIAEPGIEVVLIATPNDYHEDYAVRLAKAKKNIICEKPATLTSKSFKKMMDAAEENGVKLVVHQNRRWDKDYLTVKAIEKEGKIGKIYRIDSNVMGSHGVPGAWRKEKVHGGGMLYDWGVHLIDQALNFTDSKLVGVTCRLSYLYGLDCDDGIFATLDFANGLEYNVRIDTNAFVTYPRWLTYGSSGTAVIKSWSIDGKVVSVKEWDDKHNKGVVAGNGFTKTMAERSGDTVKVFRLPKQKADWMIFYEKYYDMMKKGAEVPVDCQSVLRCLKVMEACFQSDKEGRRIEVDL